MVTDVFSTIGGRQSTELIVRRIVDAAAAGELAPGERLPTEVEMAEAFSVAPMTLRKGLEVLRDLGVIVTRRGRGGGTFIHESAPLRIQKNMQGMAVTQRELRDLADFRNAISGEASSLAAERATDDALREFRQLTRQYDDGTHRRDELRVIDVRLHSQIALQSGSERLYEAEMRIQEDVSRILASLPDIPLMHEHTGGDHEAIVTALENRDSEASRSAMNAHIEESFEWCVALLSANTAE
ncbi:FadR/GntR family transcriptional regulator [Gulosibacter bifidus]|uniref:FadR/GntR family transcriptional regulator n=1 Tax=Gulosibacter bifidus TaxID=272239 RepID=A0ABW5RGN5_9MICO|nr:FCD domain-containing protein [Gulosibacter bifidus]